MNQVIFSLTISCYDYLESGVEKKKKHIYTSHEWPKIQIRSIDYFFSMFKFKHYIEIVKMKILGSVYVFGVYLFFLMTGLMLYIYFYISNYYIFMAFMNENQKIHYNLSLSSPLFLSQKKKTSISVSDGIS